MSRIGKKLISIPKEVQLQIQERAMQVKGPKGVVHFPIPVGCSVQKHDDSTLLVGLVEDGSTGASKALHGLTRALLSNVIVGVTEGFTKVLELVGVGYRASVQGKKLVLSLGFSLPKEYILPEGITAQVTGTQIVISGINKQQVGQVASEIRSIRMPEPYKGKGVKYLNEVIRRKAGKAMGATGSS
ncbi:MAG: 50S ribosomal protein L6 [Deltaproteobacteria bacterium]|nr:50S ribosomal protein L6 [Deltaproteobacteria bacterium]